jgi:DNA invertase Pin-like site-specific DNA recombinase
MPRAKMSQDDQSQGREAPVTFARTSDRAPATAASRGFIAYYRVSTARQGRSGLGLEAQREAVRSFLADGGDSRLIAEHVEVESGRKTNRPELQRALAACRLHSATLVIARLDRLARNAAFLLTLRDNGVEFIATDQPGANRMTVGILAMVAEYEAEAISARTRAALAAAKRRGTRLGTPENLSSFARYKGAVASAKVRRAKAAQRKTDLAPIIDEIRQRGSMTLRGIAAALNAQGWTTARGGKWTASQVRRVVISRGPHANKPEGD